MKKLLVMVAAVLFVGGSHANAQWGLGAFGFGSYYSPGMYAADTRVPYFSLYPPVYYSYPVPRPYGYSPFAYPGWTPTPHVEAMEQPHMIVNPYIQNDAVPPAPSKPSGMAQPISRDKVGRSNAVRPLMIVNPFVGDIVAGGAK